MCGRYFKVFIILDSFADKIVYELHLFVARCAFDFYAVNNSRHIVIILLYLVHIGIGACVYSRLHRNRRNRKVITAACLIIGIPVAYAVPVYPKIIG